MLMLLKSVGSSAVALAPIHDASNITTSVRYCVSRNPLRIDKFYCACTSTWYIVLPACRSGICCSCLTVCLSSVSCSSSGEYYQINLLSLERNPFRLFLPRFPRHWVVVLGVFLRCGGSILLLFILFEVFVCHLRKCAEPREKRS